MTNFEEMAKKAKAAHDAKAAEEDAAYRARKENRKASIEASVSLLEKIVVPALEQAAAAFRSQGIDSKIERDFNVHDRHESVRPRVSITLLSAARPQDGFRLEGPKGFFESDGERIYTATALEGYQRDPKGGFTPSSIEKSEAAIEKTIEWVIGNYHEYQKQRGW